MLRKIDRWVISRTLADCNAIAVNSSTVSINVSGNSIGKEDFADFVVEEFGRHEIPGERICFEITETAAIRNLDAALTFITRLHDIGCRFSLEDFASGISSFSYLKSLPVDYLKIDGALVRGVTKEDSARAMVAAIHDVVRTMNLETIAEHVSDDDILGVVTDIGIDYVQGFAVHKPAPIGAHADAAANDADAASLMSVRSA